MLTNYYFHIKAYCDVACYWGQLVVPHGVVQAHPCGGFVFHGFLPQISDLLLVDVTGPWFVIRIFLHLDPLPGKANERGLLNYFNQSCLSPRSLVYYATCPVSAVLY